MHVTLRAVHEVRCLRAQVYFAMVRSMIARSQRADFRVVHFSVQGNHIHLICEASDGRALGRGMQWLSSMIARGVNFTRGRRGPVWRERYHRTDLGSPRRVRNALRYVLMNHDKHGPQDSHTGPLLDPCSSALWFDGWSAGTRPAVEELARAVRWGPPVVGLRPGCCGSGGGAESPREPSDFGELCGVCGHRTRTFASWLSRA